MCCRIDILCFWFLCRRVAFSHTVFLVRVLTTEHRNLPSYMRTTCTPCSDHFSSHFQHLPCWLLQDETPSSAAVPAGADTSADAASAASGGAAPMLFRLAEQLQQKSTDFSALVEILEQLERIPVTVDLLRRGDRMEVVWMRGSSSDPRKTFFLVSLHLLQKFLCRFESKNASFLGH